MGFWGRLLRGDSTLIDTYDAAQRVLPAPHEPFVGYYGGGIPVADPGVPLAEYGKQAVDTIWRSQPNIRKVVDFIARNVASIPLHTYERVSDTNRRRVHDGTLAGVISTPAGQVSPFRFWHSVISDGLLYDRWAVLQVPNEGDDGLTLVQIPSWRLRLQTDALRRVRAAWYWVGDSSVVDSTADNGWKQLDLDSLIFDYGYAPNSAGLSPIETLADVLAETAEAVIYRRQIWANGARVPAWIERPATTSGQPGWSPEARERFKAAFRAAYTGDGPQAGGVPLLEDGMKLHEFESFTPQDAMDLEGRRLSAVEVAGAFHIAPELVGAREGTYSNVDAFRQMLYRDSLGPYISAWEGTLNAQLVPRLADTRNLYVEAHIETKLRGSFEEQAKVKQSATGAPWLTRNEARALENRPPVAGGDDLVVPLNVLVGGQASPNDSAPPAQLARSSKAMPHVKAAAQDGHREKLAEVLSAFFRRQGKSVLAAIGAGGDWWDAKRWDGELADDLMAVTHTLADLLGKAEADRLGYPDAYDPGRTVDFLRAVAERQATTINTTTHAQLQDALASDDASPADVFAQAESSRSDGIAVGIATFVAGFATVEAAKHIASAEGVKPTKTWLTGPNPRPAHAAMDGETVGIDDVFSNGADWPGDDGEPGCNCDVSVSIP